MIAADIDRIQTDELTAQDLPWALSLAWDNYKPSFDPGAAVLFYLNVLKSPLCFKRRSPYAFCIGTIVTAPWNPAEKELHGLVLVAQRGHHWQAVKLLRESVIWAHKHGCQHWWFTSDYSNIELLCRRIGAKRKARYVIDL